MSSSSKRTSFKWRIIAIPLLWEMQLSSGYILSALSYLIPFQPRSLPFKKEKRLQVETPKPVV